MEKTEIKKSIVKNTNAAFFRLYHFTNPPTPIPTHSHPFTLSYTHPHLVTPTHKNAPNSHIHS